MDSTEINADIDSDDSYSTSGQSGQQKLSLKFDKAKKLDGKIPGIRQHYNDVFNNPGGKSTKQQQIAVILYLLDLTGYRVGSLKDDPKNENPSGKGIANLRGKQIELLENNTVHFRFRGKRHIKYDKKHKVDKRVYDLLKKFQRGDGTMLRYVTTNPRKLKSMNAKRLIFNQIGYSDVKLEMQKFGLTPKVFRTYKASEIFEKALNDRTDKWNRANPNADENTRLIALKKFHTKARKKVKKQLNHTTLDAGDSYIDPRIIVAWCKRNKIPISEIDGFKLDTQARKKKEWAIEEEREDFVFSQRLQHVDDN